MHTVTGALFSYKIKMCALLADPVFESIDDKSDFVCVNHGPGTDSRELPWNVAAMAFLNWKTKSTPVPEQAAWLVMSVSLPDAKQTEQKNRHPVMAFVYWGGDPAPEVPHWLAPRVVHHGMVPVSDHWIALGGWTANDEEVRREQRRYMNEVQGDRNRAINQRCESIMKHGEDQEFTQSLDYYTTMRVRMACNRMNLKSLRDRYEEVVARVKKLQKVVLQRHEIGEHDPNYQVPDLENKEEGTMHGWMDDPTQLCCPCASDYEIATLDTDGDSPQPAVHDVRTTHQRGGTATCAKAHTP